MFPTARPNHDETEEDLLRFQEEFLRSKTAPSAKLIKKPDKRPAGSDVTHSMTDDTEIKPTSSSVGRDIVSLGGLPSQFKHTSTAPPIKRSKFKERLEKKEWAASTGFDAESEIEAKDSHITKVLTEIVERDVANQPVYYPKAPTTQGFPLAPHRRSEQGSEDGKQRSIFAQQFALSQVKKFGMEIKRPLRQAEMTRQEEERLRVASTGPASRHVVTGQGLNREQAEDEAKKIHMENTARIKCMTEVEILKEQQNLLETLDPSLISFFKSKQKGVGEPRGGTASAGIGGATSQAMEVDDTLHPTPTVESPANQPPFTDQTRDSLPLTPHQEWVHMDKVEHDKLSWTTDLPPPPKAENTSTGQQARFDLQGALMGYHADLPTHLGLHHHGDEPERAGYTLEELFQLARSASMQQRVLALTTIARILRNARRGALQEVVQTAVIPALLEGGVVFLIRWALDGNTDNTMAAAVHCLHSLIVCQQDEDAADHTAPWHQGLAMPFLQPQLEDIEPTDAGDEKTQETDADVIKKDVIKGLVRMQLLPRLRYILEVWKPGATVVMEVLEILTRMARHSPQTAYEIVQCPRLIKTIFCEFLPTTWTPAEAEVPLPNIHGYPVPAALKLIRIICSAGSNMAANMISNFWLMSSISRYVVEDPSDLLLPLPMATHLQLESLRTWQVCTSYGLASQSFSEMFPVLMVGVRTLPNLYHMSNSALLQWGSALVALLESVVCLGASTRHLTAHTEQMKKVPGEASRNASPAIPTINWSHVSSLLQPVELCLQNSLKDFTEFYHVKKQDVAFTSSCVNFVATFISKMDSQPGYNAVETLEHLERLSDTVLEPCLQSQAFTLALKASRDHSVLVHLEKTERREETASLPEIGAMVDNSGICCPLLKATSTTHLILAMARLLYSVGRLHKGLSAKLFKHMLSNPELVLYLRKSCQVKHTSAASNTFVRFENHLQYHLLNMARLQPSLCDAQLMHQVSLFLFTRLHYGDEHIAHELLSKIIFNADFVGDLVSVELSALTELEQLQLADQQTVPLSSATQHVVQTSREDLAKDILDHLAGIRGSFLTVGSSFVQQLHQSRGRLLTIPQQTDRLMTGAVGQVLVPFDWPFLPLVDLYNKASQRQSGSDQSMSPHQVALVCETLRWVYTLERWRPGVLDSVTFVTKLARLMCTFLAGSDLFLDPIVHMHLEAIFRLYCRPICLTRMDFTKPVPGLASFYDMFMAFVTQYEAVSFGDSLFGCFLLLPLQQRHSIEMRRAIWCEHTMVLRTLFIPIKELPIPLENFLHPEETDLGLLRLYFQALYSGAVTSQWSPVLYLVAVHHVNRFLYTQGSEHRSLQYAMLKQTANFKNKEVQRHLVYYKRTDVEAEFGMELYSELPSNRLRTLREADAEL